MTHPTILASWLRENGGGFHEDVAFEQVDSGFRIVATKDLPKDTNIVSCPIKLAITRQLAEQAVQEVLNSPIDATITNWTERQWTCTYIVLHSIPNLEYKPQLAHHKYINTLPSAEQLRTPLHFTESELSLFRGSNLYNATSERQVAWKREWEHCREAIRQVDPLYLEYFTWPQYLAAATYLSSRAFPSSVLSPTPSLISSPSTHPILLPGVDALNHARGEPVSWISEYPNPNIASSPKEPRLSLSVHKSAGKGQELFNNYGPKPNSELILGYGFSSPNNPDDTMLLKIGGVQGKHWEVGRNAQGAEGLWEAILSAIGDGSEEEPTYEDILDASGMLQEMLQTLFDRMPVIGIPMGDDIRPEVAVMFEHYIEGQHAILQSLLEFTRLQESRGVELARAQGVEIVLED